jgi:phosphoglycerate dehydrogenase-like enzyme
VTLLSQTRIVIPDDEPPIMSPSAAYRKLDGCQVALFTDRPANGDDLVRRLADATVVINIRASTKFTADVFSECPKLRLVSIWGTGTDNVDLIAAQSAGIRVTNTPGVAAIAVAEHTIALMMAVTKKVASVDRRVRRGEWPRAMVMQLRGKTLGLIGTGAIGREVAALGNAIGMRVIAWTFRSRADGIEYVPFEDVFRQSDVVSVHVRQSSDTIGLIGREHLELMKPHAVLVNTARGMIVREPDLIAALTVNRIAGAGLDVFDTEPLPADSPLRALDNVVLTPHAAGITPETTEAGLALAIDNVFSFLAGDPRNVVA